LGLRTLERLLTYRGEIQTVIAGDLKELVGRSQEPLRILDVGCGETSLLARFHGTRTRARCHLIGLDAHGPTVAWCRANGFHDEYILCDARDHAGIPAVDVIVATDLVEHFEKGDALALIAQFERQASLAVLLLTPNGYIFNPFSPDNPFMEHKCGFAVDELQRMGYDCRGLGGPKWLRGVQSVPRGPQVLSRPALAILSRCMREHPERSFHIFARKYLGVTSSRSDQP
jgi:SAM-dependent methyltransferase